MNLNIPLTSFTFQSQQPYFILIKIQLVLLVEAVLLFLFPNIINPTSLQHYHIHESRHFFPSCLLALKCSARNIFTECYGGNLYCFLSFMLIQTMTSCFWTSWEVHCVCIQQASYHPVFSDIINFFVYI